MFVSFLFLSHTAPLSLSLFFTSLSYARWSSHKSFCTEWNKQIYFLFFLTLTFLINGHVISHCVNLFFCFFIIFLFSSSCLFGWLDSMYCDIVHWCVQDSCFFFHTEMRFILFLCLVFFLLLLLKNLFSHSHRLCFVFVTLTKIKGNSHNFFFSQFSHLNTFH